MSVFHYLAEPYHVLSTANYYWTASRFLASCAKWIGAGPQLELLEILLDLGLDATLIDSPHGEDWPEPSSPNWLAEDLAPDPFFVEYQRLLLKNNQGKLCSTV